MRASPDVESCVPSNSSSASPDRELIASYAGSRQDHNAAYFCSRCDRNRPDSDYQLASSRSPFDANHHFPLRNNDDSPIFIKHGTCSGSEDLVGHHNSREREVLPSQMSQSRLSTSCGSLPTNSAAGPDIVNAASQDLEAPASLLPKKGTTLHTSAPSVAIDEEGHAQQIVMHAANTNGICNSHQSYSKLLHFPGPSSINNREYMMNHPISEFEESNVALGGCFSGSKRFRSCDVYSVNACESIDAVDGISRKTPLGDINEPRSDTGGRSPTQFSNTTCFRCCHDNNFSSLRSVGVSNVSSLLSVPQTASAQMSSDEGEPRPLSCIASLHEHFDTTSPYMLEVGDVANGKMPIASFSGPKAYANNDLLKESFKTISSLKRSYDVAVKKVSALGSKLLVEQAKFLALLSNPRQSDNSSLPLTEKFTSSKKRDDLSFISAGSSLVNFQELEKIPLVFDSKPRTLQMNMCKMSPLFTKSFSIDIQGNFKFHNETPSLEVIGTGCILPPTKGSLKVVVEDAKWDPIGRGFIVANAMGLDSDRPKELSNLYYVECNSVASNAKDGVLLSTRVYKSAISPHAKGVGCISSPSMLNDYTEFFTGGNDKSVFYWKLDSSLNFSPQYVHSLHTSNVQAILFKKDKNSVISGSCDQHLISYSVESSAPITRKKFGQRISGIQELTNNPNLFLLTLSKNANQFEIMDYRSFKTVLTFGLPNEDRNLSKYVVPSCSPCGNYVACGASHCVDGKYPLVLWDLRSVSLQRGTVRRQRHDNSNQSVFFSNARILRTLWTPSTSQLYAMASDRSVYACKYQIVP